MRSARRGGRLIIAAALAGVLALAACERAPEPPADIFEMGQVRAVVETPSPILATTERAPTETATPNPPSPMPAPMPTETLTRTPAKTPIPPSPTRTLTETPITPSSTLTPTETPITPSPMPAPSETPIPPSPMPAPTDTPFTPSPMPAPTDTPFTPSPMPAPTDTPTPPTPTGTPPPTFAPSATMGEGGPLIVLDGGGASPSVSVGGAAFEVEIAFTPEDRTRGLSGRDGLDEGAGMLFVFESGRASSFWMRDMRFALDFVWIGDACEVIEIHSDVPAPAAGTDVGQLPTYSSATPARYNLEINAGEAAKRGVEVGDAVKFIGFSGEGATCE